VQSEEACTVWCKRRASRPNSGNVRFRADWPAILTGTFLEKWRNFDAEGGASAQKVLASGGGEGFEQRPHPWRLGVAGGDLEKPLERLTRAIGLLGPDVGRPERDEE
jgi:hypothetical protein